MNPEISVIDDTFDSTITSSYFLSIQVALDGFSFCTIDPVRNEYIQFCHLKTETPQKEKTADVPESVFKQFNLLNLPFKKVFVLYSTPWATLVPSGIFDIRNSREWLSFCHQIPEHHAILHTKMRLADAWNIFAIPQKIVELFQRQFPAPLFFQEYTPMVETKLAINRYGAGQNLVLINLQPDSFNITVLEKNNLKLCNTFKMGGESDLLYFTLFVFEQLKLPPRYTQVLISGQHPSFNSATVQLGKYIKNIKPAELPGNFQYSPGFREVSGARFHNLLSLSSCV